MNAVAWLGQFIRGSHRSPSVTVVGIRLRFILQRRFAE
jgi:hypothetical protein